MEIKIYESDGMVSKYCQKLCGVTAQYKGTYRGELGFLEEYPQYHILNSTFWGMKEYYDDSTADIEALMNVKALFSKYLPLMHYEIIGISGDAYENQFGYTFLGYDVSFYNHFSLVWVIFFLNDIDYDERNAGEHIGEYVPEYVQIGPIIDVIVSYFCARLNSNGLFSSLDDARLFLKAVQSLNSLYSNLWEHIDTVSKCEVVSLFVIDGDTVIGT